MAKVTILPGHNLNALAHLAGSNRQNLSLVGDEFEVPDVTQPDLDTALADYIANQAARDSDFADKVVNEETLRVQDTFDSDQSRVLRALVTLIMKELNILRANDGLPDRTFAQLRTALRNEIANP